MIRSAIFTYAAGVELNLKIGQTLILAATYD